MGERIIFCGGRDYDDPATVAEVLADEVMQSSLRAGGPPTIVHGAATGADALVGDAAAALGLNVEAYPARWRHHGAAAGRWRNEEMLSRGAHRVVAFPGGRGTAHMVALAVEAGLPVRRVPA